MSVQYAKNIKVHVNTRGKTLPLYLQRIQI